MNATPQTVAPASGPRPPEHSSTPPEHSSSMGTGTTETVGMGTTGNTGTGTTGTTGTTGFAEPPGGSTATVALKDVVVLLGSFPALSGVNLVVRPGEIVVLRGPNGAGKTTLLQVCAGLRRPASGRAIVLGRDAATQQRALRKDVGLLGHSGFLYDELTIEENVRFAVRAAGCDPARVAGGLEALGLVDRLPSLLVSSCSAGQRRRASLAAILARDPKLWLLDEPHAGLDRETRDVIDATIRRVAASGTTVMLSSHDDERADGLATRVVSIVGGYVANDERRGPVPVTGTGAGAGLGGGVDDAS